MCLKTKYQYLVSVKCVLVALDQVRFMKNWTQMKNMILKTGKVNPETDMYSFYLQNRQDAWRS